jgi:hypothetical protein
MGNLCGCGNSNTGPLLTRSGDGIKTWIIGTVESAIGPIPKISTRLGWRDRLGGWKVRWGVGRMDYSVQPGLYAVGTPNPQSPVLVTANYKLTLDALRCELEEISAWIMILDTRGINVWCAAGKGTFGTDEVVNRVAATRLSEVVTHRRLILPQLGAPGVSAHQVAQRSGFAVDYGPVRARDLPDYLARGGHATPEMRRVTFTLCERLVVVPIEIVQAWKPALAIVIFLMLIAALGRDEAGFLAAREAVGFFGAFLAGTVATAALLPWLPFRAFAGKGYILGLAWAVLIAWLFPSRPIETIAGLLLLPALSAFLAMNYTGASTFTSPTGAVREVKTATPIIAVLALAGATLKLISLGVTLF